MWELIGYHPEDFLLFSKNIYYDLIASYNQAVWPLHAVCLLVFILLFVLTSRNQANKKIQIGLLLTFVASLCFMGKVYFFDYFRTINWASRYIAIGFFIQSGLLVLQVFSRKPERHNLSLSKYSIIIFAVVIFFIPIIEWLIHDRFEMLPIIGVDPDITMMALITYVVLFKRSWWLLILPMLWLMLSVVMHHTMGAQEFVSGLFFLCCLMLYALKRMYSKHLL